MKRSRKLIVWVACGGGSLVLLASAYFAWDDILFAWKFEKLAHREGGYVVPSLRNELPEAELALESWIVERGAASLPRLRSRLGSADRLKKLAALHLIAKIQSDRGIRTDLDDFWRAFEDRSKVESYLVGPLEVILAGGASGIHVHEETGVLLARFLPEKAVLWRVKAEPETPEERIEAEALRSLRRRQGESTPPRARIRKCTLEGEDARRLKLDLARALSLTSFEEFPWDFARNRYCWLTEARAGSKYLHFTGWSWLDQLADHYANLAEAVPGEEEGSFADDEALEFLLTVVDSSPSGVGALHVLAGLLELNLSPAGIDSARNRLRALPPTALYIYSVGAWFNDSFRVPGALHILGDRDALLKALEGRPFDPDQIRALIWLVAAKPEGALPVVLRKEELVPRWLALDLRWKLAGLALDVFTPHDAAWLRKQIATAGADDLRAFLEGTAENRAARLHPVVLEVLRKAASPLRAAYLKKLGLEPPLEDTEEAWAKLLDELEKKEAAPR